MRILAMMFLLASLGFAEEQESNSFFENTSLSISAFAGGRVSRIQSSGDARYFFEATSGLEDIYSPTWGVAFEWKINTFLSTSIGFQYAKLGQYTTPTTVELYNDPFLHTFESRTEMKYVAVPLLVKAGYTGKRQWAAFRLGVVPSGRVEKNISWKIDGNEIEYGAYAPNASVNRADIRLLGGAEYGVILGRNGIFIAADYEHGVYNIVNRIKGYAINRSVVGMVGYRFFL